MIRERGEPAIADTSKPILEAPVVPDFPSNPTVPRESLEDPDVLAATNHTLDYNDTEEEILDIDDDNDDIIVNNGGLPDDDDELINEDDDLDDDEIKDNGGIVGEDEDLDDEDDDIA